MKHQVISTKDGSKTLFVPEMDEQYHSLNGAFTESNHVFIDAAYRSHKSDAPVVFEVGFGTGLNALLTALESDRQKRDTLFISIEKYPLELDLVQQLNYGSFISEKAQIVFKQLHAAPWELETRITKHFKLLKIEGDLKNYDFKDFPEFDLVYFDAFGPDKQPNMWNQEIFTRIFAASAENSIFTTYSAKGSIRRQLRDCGYSMERLPGPPGKRQMLRGTKISSDVE